MTSPDDDLLAHAHDFRSRLRVAVGQPKAAVRRPAPWYEIRNEAVAGSSPDETDVYLYDVIGGWCGITAQQFVEDLRGIDSDVINLHISSPGGDVFDAIAIYQALRNHPARIVTYVDSLAASAASFIAMAGDKRIIAPYGSVMIHDAWGMCVGNAAEMDKMRSELDRLSGTIASIYADRGTGGDLAEWRDAMHAETWYSADEAVEAGLMHERQADAEKGSDGNDGSGTGATATNRWDLSVFNYAGRDRAPAPRFPGRPARAQALAAEKPTDALAGGDEPGENEDALASTTDVPAAEPEQPTEPKEAPVATLSTDVLDRLGLDSDADDTAVLAAVDALKSQAQASVQPDPAADAAVKAQADENTALRKEVDLLASRMESVTTELAAAKAEKAAATKASVLAEAKRLGKISPADEAQWSADYDEAPAAVTRMLDRLATGTAVPVAAVGHVGGDELAALEDDAEIWARLDGPSYAKGN